MKKHSATEIVNGKQPTKDSECNVNEPRNIKMKEKKTKRIK